MESPLASEIEFVPLASLRPHPRNYRRHTPEQLAEISASVDQFGVYRNIVIASDDVILAGHGLAEVLRAKKRASVAVIRIPIAHDSPLAIKLMIADNMIPEIAIDDQRALTDMLAEIKDVVGLEGTGINEEQLATLLLTTRPASEIPSPDASAWSDARMPEYEEGESWVRLMVLCRSEETRQEAIERLGCAANVYVRGEVKSVRYPFEPKGDRLDIQST